MKDKLKAEILSSDLSFFLSQRVFERVPHIFKNKDELLNWKEKFSSKIKVDPSSIVFIGSASLGFSLNPNKNFKSFDIDSDIDIAIISRYYFDVSWRALRNFGARRYTFTQTQKNSLLDHTQRLIYWGTIATDSLLPVLPFGKEWMESLEQMNKISPTNNNHINLRLYKDFDSLRAYHINNLKQIKNELVI